jgi:hypothetical protein
MSISNKLLGTAGGLLGGLGTHNALLKLIYSPDCIAAVERKSQLDVYSYCPPGFNDFSLITIISVCIVITIWIYFWKDILQEVLRKVTSSD